MGGMAVRAHAPDGPIGPGASRSISTSRRAQGPGRVLRAARASEGYTPDKRTTRCSARSRATSWTRPVTGRSTCSSTGSRCATLRVRRSPRPRRRRRCRSPTCCCRSSRSSRSTARTSSTRSSCSPSTRSPRTTARPTPTAGSGRSACPRILVVHLERLGLVADRHRQPRHAGRVPRRRTSPTRTSTSANGRSASTRAGQVAGLRQRDRRGPQVDPLEAPRFGRRARRLVQRAGGDGPRPSPSVTNCRARTADTAARERCA